MATVVSRDGYGGVWAFKVGLCENSILYELLLRPGHKRASPSLWEEMYVWAAEDTIRLASSPHHMLGPSDLGHALPSWLTSWTIYPEIFLVQKENVK